MWVSKEKKSREPLSRAATILEEKSGCWWLSLRTPRLGAEHCGHRTGQLCWAYRNRRRDQGQEVSTGAGKHAEARGPRLNSPLPLFICDTGTAMPLAEWSQG